MNELEFAAMVDSVSCADDFASLLRESHPVYSGRGEAAVHRMRGWVLTRFHDRFPKNDALLSFAREEVESGIHPYAVAAAARALRGTPIPESTFESVLARIGSRDEPVQFDAYPTQSGVRATTSAKAQIEGLRPAQGLVLLGSRPRPPVQVSLLSFEVEDQDGARYRLGGFLKGRPSFVIFFYTRCNNPNKCSANVARWLDVARQLGNQANFAAISYDPDYDTPERLQTYAVSRGLNLPSNARLLRVPEYFIELRRGLDLNVNYGPATVNRHASEALILDSDGLITEDIRREVWTVDEVISSLRAPVEAGREMVR